MSQPRRVLWVSLALGALLAPPLNWHALVWVAWVPLLAQLVRGAHGSCRGAALQAAAVGGAYYLALSWPFLSLGWWGWGTGTEHEVQTYLLVQRCLMLLVVAALASWGAVLWGACGWVTAWAVRRGGITAWWVAPVVWLVTVEWLGHAALGGFTWGYLGNHLIGVPVLQQAASAFGPLGLSLVVLVVNAAGAVWWATRGRASMARAATAAGRARRASLLLSGLTVLGSLGYGVVRMQARDGSSADTLRVAVAQTDAATAARPDVVEGRVLLPDAGWLRQAAEGQDVLVLPEALWWATARLDDVAPRWTPTGVVVDPAPLGAAMAAVADGVVVHGLDTLAGGATHNAVLFWDRGALAGRYFKRLLVPFSEYRPQGLGWLTPRNQLHGEGFEYARGGSPEPVVVAHTSFGALICQEILFPPLAQALVDRGAGLLVAVGNDGVFRSAWVARMFHRLAVLQAVSVGRPMLRSMKTGVSSVIDSRGRVLASLAAGRGILSARVAPASGRTLYGQWGDGLGVLGAFALGAGLLGLRRRTVAA